MLKAIRYEILRNMEANGRASIPLEREPVRVATLLNEPGFLEDNYLIHQGTVLLEDRQHDWTWEKGRFRYFARIALRADVLIVYEEAEVDPPRRFDPQTGERLTS